MLKGSRKQFHKKAQCLRPHKRFLFPVSQLQRISGTSPVYSAGIKASKETTLLVAHFDNMQFIQRSYHEAIKSQYHGNECFLCVTPDFKTSFSSHSPFSPVSAADALMISLYGRGYSKRLPPLSALHIFDVSVFAYGLNANAIASVSYQFVITCRIEVLQAYKLELK